jgi:hypothetical protein
VPTITACSTTPPADQTVTNLAATVTNLAVSPAAAGALAVLTMLTFRFTVVGGSGGCADSRDGAECLHEVAPRDPDVTIYCKSVGVESDHGATPVTRVGGMEVVGATGGAAPAIAIVPLLLPRTDAAAATLATATAATATTAATAATAATADARTSECKSSTRH